MTTLNGLPLLSLSLTIPRVGAWVARALVDSDVAPTGDAVLELAGRRWSGTVTRGGVELGRWSGTIVGGAGGLSQPLPAVALRNTSLAEVLSESLRDVGELLAGTSGDLSATVARWHRIEAPAAHTVADVARQAGYVWRVLADGTVWMGLEAWAPAALPAPVDVLDVDPHLGRWLLAGDGALDATPGTVVTLDGTAVRVGAVEHTLTGSELRSVVFEERANDPANRLTAAIEAIVRRTMRRVDYLALYPARVVQQHGDGTLDLQPDDPRVPAPREVPYRTLPGVALTVPAGTRVLLGYEGGEPTRPVALLWELGDVTSLAIAGGTHHAARQGHAVRVTIPIGAVVVMTMAGPVSNPTPITLDGTITEGSDELLLT